MTGGRREIILDTEGTGLTHGDRVIELAMVELRGGVPTGVTWLSRFDPEGQPVHWAARRAHGIHGRDLVGQPLFRDRVDEILDFIADSRVIVHNAPYDFRMMNGEMKIARRPALPAGRFTCSLAAARRLFPGDKCGIDDLVQRLMPGASARGRHDALGDCLLLAELLPHLADHLEVRASARPVHPAASGGSGSAPGFGEGVGEDLREAMAQVRHAHEAFALRLGGGDVWSRVPEPLLRPVADGAWGAAAVEAGLRHLSEKRRVAALRWMCRGLSPDLAGGREAIAQVQYDNQPLENGSPSP